MPLRLWEALAVRFTQCWLNISRQLASLRRIATTYITWWSIRNCCHSAKCPSPVKVAGLCVWILTLLQGKEHKGPLLAVNGSTTAISLDGKNGETLRLTVALRTPLTTLDVETKQSVHHCRSNNELQIDRSHRSVYITWQPLQRVLLSSVSLCFSIILLILSRIEAKNRPRLFKRFRDIRNRNLSVSRVFEGILNSTQSTDLNTTKKAVNRCDVAETILGNNLWNIRSFIPFFLITIGSLTVLKIYVTL